MNVLLALALIGGELCSLTPRLLNPGEITSGTHWIGGWVGHGAGLDDVEVTTILCQYRDTNCDPSATFCFLLVTLHANSDPSYVSAVQFVSCRAPGGATLVTEQIRVLNCQPKQ
jgi:hypothetical protein